MVRDLSKPSRPETVVAYVAPAATEILEKT